MVRPCALRNAKKEDGAHVGWYGYHLPPDQRGSALSTALRENGTTRLMCAAASEEELRRSSARIAMDLPMELRPAPMSPLRLLLSAAPRLRARATDPSQEQNGSTSEERQYF